MRVTVADAIARLRRAFAAAGLPTPDLDARFLVAGVLGIEASGLPLRSDHALSPEAAERVAGFAARRLAREPVARILGEWEFWGLPFTLSPETLVPRPDTETLVEVALRLVPERAPFTLLDLGTGSGALLVAILSERPAAFGIGTDLSEGALRSARRNAVANGVGARAAFVRCRYVEALRGPVDLLLSNPPYIASAVIPGLAPEVREHDPALALDGGPDGLDAYRAILADAPRLLAPRGLLILEIGADQGESVPALVRDLPLAIQGLHPDLSGTPRCLVLERI